jgi:hypothetical protein
MAARTRNLELKMITDHARRLAREVIARAYESYLSRAVSDDLDYCREVVIHALFPIHGRGGVAKANARTQREVRATIAELYAFDPPSDLQEKKRVSYIHSAGSLKASVRARLEARRPIDESIDADIMRYITKNWSRGPAASSMWYRATFGMNSQESCKLLERGA